MITSQVLRKDTLVPFLCNTLFTGENFPSRAQVENELLRVDDSLLRITVVNVFEFKHKADYESWIRK